MAMHVSDLLVDYLNEELEASRCLAVEAHLEQCASCRAELASLSQLHSSARESLLFEAPGELWSSIDEAIRRVQQQSPDPELDLASEQRRWSAEGFGTHYWGWGLAAAAAVILVFASVLLFTDRGVPGVQGEGFELASFVAALESSAREPDGRELGKLPRAFERMEKEEAAAQAGLISPRDSGLKLPTTDSELYGGRIDRTQAVYQLILGNEEGPYLLFAFAKGSAPHLDRASGSCPGQGVGCQQFASETLSLFVQEGVHRNWLLIGRYQSDAFYERVLDFVAER